MSYEESWERPNEPYSRFWTLKWFRWEGTESPQKWTYRVVCHCLEWKAINSSERENNAESGARLIRRGRRIAWFSIPAWGVGNPGFKSQRPHHKTSSILSTFRSWFTSFLPVSPRYVSDLTLKISQEDRTKHVTGIGQAPETAVKKSQPRKDFAENTSSY